MLIKRAEGNTLAVEITLQKSKCEEEEHIVTTVVLTTTA